MSRSLKYFLFALAAAVAGIAIRLGLPPSPMQEVRHVAVSLRGEIERFQQEATLVSEGLSRKDSTVFRDRTFSFFLFRGSSLVRWSDNAIVPRQLPAGTESLHLLQTAQGDFLTRNWLLPDSSVLSGMITLRRKYPITNQYLSTTWNENIFSSATRDILPPQAPEGWEMKDARDEVLFRIAVVPNDLHPLSWTSKLELALDALAILLLILAVSGWVRTLHRRGQYWLASIFLLVAIYGIRRVMVAAHFPDEFFHSTVFDPSRFASSDFNNSIGNLFLNTLALLFLAIYADRTYTRWRFWRRVIRGEAHLRQAGSIILMVAAFFTFLLPFLYFETIYHNSAITIDIMRSLSFSMVQILALLSVLLSCAASWYFLRIFFRLAVLMQGRSWKGYIVAVLVGAAVLSVYHWSTDRAYEIPIVLGLFFMLALFVVYHVFSRGRRRVREYSVLALGVIFFAALAALSVRLLAEERQRDDQLRYASSLLERDVLGEYLLNETARRISGDAFIRGRMASPFLSKSPIRQKVKRLHLNNYFDRYQVSVYLFDGTGRPLDDDSGQSLPALLQEFQPTAAITEFEGIFFVDIPASGVMKRYVVVAPVQQGKWTAGFVVLDLSLKRIQPQNVYPELLVDNRFGQYLRNKDFSSVLFSGTDIVSTSGTFNYDQDFDPEWLGQPALYRQGLRQDGLIHLAVDNGSGKVVVVSGTQYRWYGVFSNFSFFALIGLLLLLFVLVLRAVQQYVRQQETMQYATRIQVFVYLAFSLPLLAVSLTTLQVISASNREQTAADFGVKSALLAEKVAPQWLAFQRNEISEAEFESELLQESQAAGIDASLFSSTGHLLASTQSDLYGSQLLSRYLHPAAFREMIEGKENYTVLTERIGKLVYSNYYSVVRSPETRQELGVLSVPYLESADSQEKAEIRVLANILNIFMVVFIVFSLLSFVAAGRLTYPLRLMTRTLRRTSLVGENQPMSWDSKDEMGALVTEYNRMVENLRRSRDELAQRQRETAWRDIARQVAHEIKNPLTPMKLTLQQMERKLEAGEQSSERTAQSVQAMLQQVEVLNDIASSFSSFAQMPSLVLEELDLGQLIQSSMDLLAGHPQTTIAFTPPAAPVMIRGDQRLLSRIFSNLALNAIQSRVEGKSLELDIRLEVMPAECRVYFHDNGSGIPAHLQDKVFVPYFSTKKSGSGIGLAVARQGIEQLGGKIWFESAANRGTTFIVQLPRL